jgi:chromosomal replication initiator protein
VNPQEAWIAAFNQLEIQLDRATFDTWLRDTVYLGFEGGVFRLGVRNNYALDMLQHRLYRMVRRVLSDFYGEPIELGFEIHKVERTVTAPNIHADMPLLRLLAEQEQEEPAPPLHRQVSRPQQPDLPEFELNPRYTFDRFIAGNANALAQAAARAVAENPGRAYNPFLIYGGVGLGKTHLLQAIAHVCRQKNLRALYISSEVFTNDLIDSIRQRTTAMFRERYRSADVLLMDDIQFIGGKESTQEEFFHTFNALHMYNKQVVLASDRHPSELEDMVDRLKSRFQSGLLMSVHPPELETRIAIVQMWAQEQGVTLPKAVYHMLAERAPNNLRELESNANQVIARAHLTREPITLQIAEALLERYERPRHYRLALTPAFVIEATAEYYGVSVHELIGPRRTGRLNLARQMAMYVAREITDASLPQIGEAFGGRSHTTILHGCTKIAEELGQDFALQHDLEALRERLLKNNL